MTPSYEAQHGTRARYVGGCGCDDCRAANSAYEHGRRHGRRVGTGRRAPVSTWLAAYMAAQDGEVRTDVVKAAAEAAGMSWRGVRSARETGAYQSRRSGQDRWWSPRPDSL